MANGFNSGTYEIYWHKDQQQGTPNAPQSPTTSMARSPVDNTFGIRKAALVGLGMLIVQKTVSTLGTEIGATTGNEVLQTTYNNIIKGVGIVTVALASPVALVGVGISSGISEIVRQRSVVRENRAIQYDNKLRGGRVTYGQGGVY